MKKFYLLLILLVSFSLFSTTIIPFWGGQASAQVPTPDPILEEKAREIVDALAQDAFEQVSSTFSPDMRSALPTPKLQEAWNSLIKQMGGFVNIAEILQTRQEEYDILYVTSKFAKGVIDIKLVFDSSGQVSGLFFVPAGTGRSALHVYTPAAYTDSSAFTEREVEINSGEWVLPGTLTLPNGTGPFPALVLVHGSGPNDRDETIGPNKPFRDLAEGLATQGIAVLRYDKRTKVYPEKMAASANSITVQEEVIDDALAAMKYLRDISEIDPQNIFLLGHSLGGMLAPRIATQAPELAGIIILAGPTRPLEDLIIEQVTYLANLDGNLSAEEQAQIEQLVIQVQAVKDTQLAPNTPAEQLLGIPASYWLDLRDENPAQTAQSLEIPMLILRGERDYQVGEADFQGWLAALENTPDVYLKQYPGLNHLFIRGSGKSTPAEYEREGHVAEAVVDDIASFILTGTVNLRTPLFGTGLSTQDIIRLILLLLPILLIQLGVSIYALVDLTRRKKTHGPRWLWAVLLVITLFALPSGFIVSAVYLIWGRKEDEEDGDDDPN